LISICALIYKSTRYADALWESVNEFTDPKRARFFFLANNASESVIFHLRARGYPFIEYEHEENVLDGYDPPQYMRGVYKGWNRAILESEETCVLVNSDMMFSPGWLEGLLRYYDGKNIVSSKLVERRHPQHGVFGRAIERDFGSHPDNFQKKEFLSFVSDKRISETEEGGAYMPCVFSRARAIEVGLYPEGNPKGSYGDRVFFERMGVPHITSLQSIVYHFKEGEMSE